VYTFALLLFVYLLATRIGSVLYRKHLANRCVCSIARLAALLSIAAFLPLILNDPQIMREILRLPGVFLLFAIMISIFPYCALLGYLTPLLIDRFAGGNPGEAGRAYAINISGCILGPLLASYLLLPQLGAKNSMIILALPFLVFFCFYFRSLEGASRWVVASIAGSFLASSIFFHRSYEDPRGINSAFYAVRRDYTATVTSMGQDMNKRLYVNGIGITYLTPITKFMAHLPLGFLPEKPESALVICFGMGTTYRSLMSWDIDVKGVELVPSVKTAFAYYFDDAKELLRNPKGQIIIDDGRRFLKRTKEKFDVITIDAPPPVEAVGSSLLYSTEFYESVKEHLKPHGILQQWFPGGETQILQAVVRSLTDAFTHLRVYQSVEGWGYHFIASMRPVRIPAPPEIVRRMPKRAQIDLLEWNTEKDLDKYLSQVLAREVSIDQLLPEDANIRITDDRPFNEYFLLRRLQLKPFAP
jgi:predicted membrane-bound spermidine synthase